MEIKVNIRQLNSVLMVQSLFPEVMCGVERQENIKL